MPSQRLEEVEVWRKARAWVLGSYRLTENFPKQEMFGLTSQLSRAAVSVPANFAEGFQRLGISGEVALLQHRAGFIGGMQVLFDLGAGLKIW